MKRLVLRSFQSPGDIVMLTAAVRDLHAAYPGQFQTDVRTSANALWENNPHLTRLNERDEGVRVLDMHYPLIHQSNQRPYHFIHGYAQFLEQQLDLRIPITRFAGDIHLSNDEQTVIPLREQGVPDRFWIIVAGGKYDFTAKWWNPASFQAVVDHFQGRIQFVQCGEAGHWHVPLNGVVNVIGKSTLRDFVRLVYFAEGVICPVTLAMHLAAAIPSRGTGLSTKPCVVVAGGREPAHWEAYPNHQFISTNGALSCCASGGCWKCRCQKVGDGDAKDGRDLCESPVQIRPELRIPRCMDLITPADVIRRVEMYFDGGILLNGNGHSRGNQHMPKAPLIESPAEQISPVEKTNDQAISAHADKAVRKKRILVVFRHGLGDAVQFTVVLKHLQQLHPDWDVDIATLVGKHSAFQGLCRGVLIIDHDQFDQGTYTQTIQIDWGECRQALTDCPSTKPSRCLREVFKIEPRLDWCRYTIRRRQSADRLARAYLAQICGVDQGSDGRFPTVIFHYEGNTSADRKNLSHELAREVCDTIQAAGHVPVILDWDRRSPLPDGKQIFSPSADHDLWGGKGTGDAEVIAALCQASRLVIGVDSGPLHVAGATTTPTVGVWTHHHPIHYFDLADDVLHLVPGDHEKIAPGSAALKFFREHYRHQVYKQLSVELPALVQSMLTGEDFELLANQRFLKCLSSRSFDHRYYEEHRAAGLDYLGFGDWQRQYARWLVESLGLKGKRVLDVGCACGSILRGLGEAGAVVQGVDVSEHMIRLGREKWPDMSPLLFVCDAVNLHLFADASWDAIHTAQVAEHWKPELVPHILRELARVVSPGGLLFCALDTEELFARQGRELEKEDPTHVCIRPMTWWHEQLQRVGWQVCSDSLESALRSHPEGFLSRYDWDWFIARRIQQ